MKPKEKFISIKNNSTLIKQLLTELVLEPRLKTLKWSAVTKQTSNIKVGYIGQHLASLVVGMPGQKTGARGNDIIDGSEVKACSRLDALDTCLNVVRKKKCNEKVSRYETKCPRCGSENILRSNDSKWLFTIRNSNDLKILTKDVNRIILVLSDYPKFDVGNFEDIRFQVFEIWTKSQRCKEFSNLMSNYFKNIYGTQKKNDQNKVPAPKNFWPYSYQFYKCNPIKIFSCIVKNANTKPTIENFYYIKPSTDRNTLKSELMPSSILTKDEHPALKKLVKTVPKNIIEKRLNRGKIFSDFKILIEKRPFNKKAIVEYITYFDETLRDYLPLRTDKSFTLKTAHARRKS